MWLFTAGGDSLESRAKLQRWAQAGTVAGKVHERGFDGTKFHGSAGHVIDFDPRVSMTDNKSRYYHQGPAIRGIATSPILAFMWAKAAKEWQPLK